MFGSRRHRPPSQPLTAATANPNATTAAASAFIRQASPSNLSSAAAAAALRSRPITPTNVAEVQTKRTMRRSASATGDRGGKQGFKRSPSAGSMSERSLRSNSPRRPTTPRRLVDGLPPVPAIPERVAPMSGDDPNLPNTRRATNPQTQPLKLGSEVMREGRSSWFGPAITDSSARIRTSDSVLHDPDLRPTSSGSSINFSYPRGSRVTSPTPSSPSPNNKTATRHVPSRPKEEESDQALVYDPNTRRMMPRAELRVIELCLSKPRRKTSRRKKKKQTSTASSDSGVSRSSRPDRSSVELEKPIEAPGLATGRTHADTGGENPTKPEIRANEAQQFNFGPNVDAAAIPDNQNSQDASNTTAGTTTRAATRSPNVLAAGKSSQASRVQPHTRSDVEPNESGGRALKTASATPQRSVSLVEGENLVVPVRHSPPPRSVSPIKSALKQSVSPHRDSSISDHGSEVSTDMMNSQQFDPIAARKKSVRVSFDDKNTIVLGEAASDDYAFDAASPGTRRRWHNLAKRRGVGTSYEDGVDDEVMKPRPALPSFGRIRDKKGKGHEERPLVRPQSFTNASLHPVPPAISPTTPYDPNLKAHETDLSNDHAIGAALTKDLGERNEANISRLREPLPPEVTSVEGDGFFSDESTSDSLLSSDDEDQHKPSAPTGGADEGTLTIESNGLPVPQIAISEPSPEPVDGFEILDSAVSSESDEFFDLPGAFPGSWTSDTDVTSASSATAGALWRQARHGAETDPLLSSVVEAPLTPESSAYHELPTTIEEESEESGIYSDAYEDLSDVDGDGFQSLDAVVDSPTRPAGQQMAMEKAMSDLVKKTEVADRPTTYQKSANASNPAQSVSDASADADWEQAKAYWRSLSLEKRKQLEREALQDAGNEGDLDELKAPAPKKKSAKKERSAAARQKKALSTASAANVSDAEQPRSVLPKSLRGASRVSRSNEPSGPQSQSESPRRMRSLRSPPPEAPSGVASEGGLRKTLRSQRSPPRDAVAGENGPNQSRPLSLRTSTSSLRLPQKFKARKRTASLEDDAGVSFHPDWTGSPIQRRGSVSSESSFRRSTPRPESAGFRRSMRSDAGRSGGAPPDTNSVGTGSFSLRSLSPRRVAFRRGSLGSNPPASPDGRMRTGRRSESSDGSSRRLHMPSLNIFSKMGRRSKVISPDSSISEDVPRAPPTVSPTARKSTTVNGAAAPDVKPSTANGRLQENSEELSDLDQASPTAALSTQPTNGAAGHPGSGRDSQAKPESSHKGGLMSVLWRRKADQKRIARPERTDSAARRDTRLERSASELEALRNTSSGQGRGPADDDDVDSVDAVARSSPRKHLKKRRGGADAANAQPPGEPGKKKFSALRRVFKMDA